MNNISNLSDSDIVNIICNSDKEMYAEIIRRYQTKLLRYARFIVGDNDKGADVVQESFIKAYINLKGFNPKKKFSSWIYRIVHNEAMNMLNKDKKQQPINEYGEFDSGINLEDDFIKNELINHTHLCLNQIPIIYREPLSLFYLDEKSYEEISYIMRIPIGTVGTRVNRAKGLMKKICQKR